MFSDGETLDVEAVRDDSDLREAMLQAHYGKTIKDPKDGRIEGVAVLEVQTKKILDKRPTRR